jgi:hypothetical protein
MYVEKALEKLAAPRLYSLEGPSSEEIAAQQARWSRAWKIGQTIFAHAAADEVSWSRFTTETSKGLLTLGAAGGILAPLPRAKLTDTVTRSPWVDFRDKAEAQIAMTDQHYQRTFSGLGRLFGGRASDGGTSWDRQWFDLHIRVKGANKAARYATVDDGGRLALPALADLKLAGTEQAEAEAEALQVLEVIAAALDTETK